MRIAAATGAFPIIIIIITTTIIIVIIIVSSVDYFDYFC
jgi:hypothetical protein